MLFEYLFMKISFNASLLFWWNLMATKEIERKIAVIFATDVVGFSKSIESNEEKTIKSLRACKNILEDLFKEHDVRIFNTAGDSVLAEFSIAVSAVVLCGTE